MATLNQHVREHASLLSSAAGCGAAAHAGHQFRGVATNHAKHLDGLADRIDTATDPGDFRRTGLVGFVDMDLEDLARLQPRQPA